jgi:hypothetical protein
VFERCDCASGAVTHVWGVAVLALSQQRGAFVEAFDRNWKARDVADRLCRFEEAECTSRESSPRRDRAPVAESSSATFPAAG